jgi:hypothetical protein
MQLTHDPAAMRAVQKLIDEHPEIYGPDVYKARQADVQKHAPAASAAPTIASPLSVSEAQVMLLKGALEREFEALAKARVERTGETYFEAYSKVMVESDVYRRYAELR